EAQVIAVPSRKYGEEVMAWVKPKPGVGLTPEELKCHCVGRIASFKVPRYWRITTEFPLTVTGKVQKFRMREIAIRELGLADDAVWGGAGGLATAAGCWAATGSRMASKSSCSNTPPPPAPAVAGGPGGGA